MTIMETKITRKLFTAAQLEIQQHAYLAGSAETHTYRQQHKHMLTKRVVKK